MPPSTTTCLSPATVGLSVSAAPERSIRRPPAAHSWYTHLKPVVEGALALGALVFFAPLLMLIGLCVRWWSPGPALYTQVRVGRDRRAGRKGYTGPDRRNRNQGGEPFSIIKFRSMRVDAEAKTGAVWAQGHDDPRITPFGRFMRASHIDELPQLLNVVRGEMSLVGPRPERPEFFGGLAAEVPGYRNRTAVRPGVTGLAQVRHKYDETLDDVRRKVELDLEYIESAGVRTDIKILLRTVLRCWGEFRDMLDVRRTPRRRKARAQS